MKILITGAGIAGLTTAFWLVHYGHEVTIIEKDADFRLHSGYMIDFWGPGFEVALKMGLHERLAQRHYSIPKMIYVNDQGREVGHLDVIKLRRMMNNREFTFLRGDLEDVIYSVVVDAADILPGVTIKSMQQTLERVDVVLSNQSELSFDLVIGADGIHSSMRQQLFGEERQFSKYLGYQVGAFIQPNTLGIDNFIAYSKPAKQVALFPIRDNRLATYFIYKSEKERLDNAKQCIIDQFQDLGWRIQEILVSLSAADEVYLDAATQICLPQWYQGRVALVGDACQCLTLLSGQGASMAMAGGYLLAKELDRCGDQYDRAFAAYQRQLLPDILRKQKQAIGFIRQMVPNTEFGIMVRNRVTNLLNLTVLSKLYFDRSFQFSRKYLPEYLL